MLRTKDLVRRAEGFAYDECWRWETIMVALGGVDFTRRLETILVKDGARRNTQLIYTAY